MKAEQVSYSGFMRQHAIEHGRVFRHLGISNNSPEAIVFIGKHGEAMKRHTESKIEWIKEKRK